MEIGVRILLYLAVLTRVRGADDATKEAWRDDGELWLEDFTGAKTPGGHMQSDSPSDGADDEDDWAVSECPHVPDTERRTLRCLRTRCVSDIDCPLPTHKCCHNGCLTTCMKAVLPPPFIDWRREPQRDPLTGISWLIKDEEAQDDIERAVSPHTRECFVDNVMYTDGQQFVHHRHKCKCHKGLVDCVVST